MPSTHTSLVTSSFTLIPNVESKSCARFQFQSRQLKGRSQRYAAFKPGLDQQCLRERLSGLALIHIHRDVSLNCDDIIIKYFR
jgi:hypothetical protein